MTTFGARLHAAVQERGPLCAGIDPHTGLLHDWGLDDDVAGLERFALTAAEALAPRVSVVKPQSAFYERFGSRGIAVLERLVTTCRDLTLSGGVLGRRAKSGAHFPAISSYRGGQTGFDRLGQAESRLPMRLTREHQIVPASARA